MRVPPAKAISKALRSLWYLSGSDYGDGSEDRFPHHLTSFLVWVN